MSPDSGDRVGESPAGSAPENERPGRDAGYGLGAERLAAAITRASGEAIVVSDPGGVITVWNAGAERVFGHPAAIALGQSLDLIIGDKQRARHWTGYDATMATGQTKYGDTLLRVPAVHAGGRRLSIEFSVALLAGEDGKVAGICAFIRDVSEAWAAERELRVRLAAAERALAQATEAAGAPPAGPPRADTSPPGAHPADTPLAGPPPADFPAPATS
jgi:PAS domain S-box-containing protein